MRTGTRSPLTALVAAEGAALGPPAAPSTPRWGSGRRRAARTREPHRFLEGIVPGCPVQGRRRARGTVALRRTRLERFLHIAWLSTLVDGVVDNRRESRRRRRGGSAQVGAQSFLPTALLSTISGFRIESLPVGERVF
ncbi:hypothetical protein GCM10028787_30450 [Brachybacterium horti]